MTPNERLAEAARQLTRIALLVNQLSVLPIMVLAEDATIVPDDHDLEEMRTAVEELSTRLDKLKKQLPPRKPRARPYHRRRGTGPSRPS